MWGDIISGGMKLIGGFFNNDSEERRNDAVLRDKAEDRALQREFAQNGLRWKVEDGKAAGLHPLVAVGGSGAAYTPSSISLTGGNAIGDALASAGQDIGRAVDATRSPTEKVSAFTQKVQSLTLSKMELENQLLASQIGKNRAQTGPAMPALSQRWLVDGQGQTAAPNLVQDDPLKRTTSEPGKPWSEPGAINDIGYARTSDGGYAPVPSKDVKERIEDNLFQEFMWSYRNNVLPWLGMNETPPPGAPDYRYDVYTGQYRKPRYRFHNKGSIRDLMDYRYF